MYIYIDESGNFGWPLKAGSEPYMLFSLLVIDDHKSKQAIAQAVSRAITDLRKRHPSFRSDSKRYIKELKGSNELADCPDVRLSFFRRIVRKAKFHIYSVILDKRVLKQPLPENYMERYSMLLLNILYAIPIPKNQRWVTMVVDSQATAEPTQPVKVRYNSKTKRLRQKKTRDRDRNRRNQYTQMITSVFKNVLKKKGTHLKVWHIRSHDDRCLQAVDVIGHFSYRRLKLDDKRRELFQNFSTQERSREFLEKNIQWQKIKDERTGWFEAYEVLRSKIEWIRRPTYLVRHNIDRLAQKAQQYRRSKIQGQP
jgi:FtsZ-binding cell division protein ZapB